MNFLLDTQIVLWLSVTPQRLSKRAIELVENRTNRLYFSPVSLVEIAIKRGTDRGRFLLNPGLLRLQWLAGGFSELPVTGVHAAAMDALPPIHKDPFDRPLLAQAMAEHMTLLTADGILVRYPSHVMDAR